MDIRKYKITNAQRRDEWGPVHGSMMQDYAIALEGEEGWIKLTQKVDTRPPQEGDELEGFIETKTNTNGNTYRKFKKENPKYAGANRSDGHSSSSGSQEGYIVQMLEELTGRRDVVDRVAEVPDEPLDDPFKDL